MFSLFIFKFILSGRFIIFDRITLNSAVMHMDRQDASNVVMEVIATCSDAAMMVMVKHLKL